MCRVSPPPLVIAWRCNSLHMKCPMGSWVSWVSFLKSSSWCYFSRWWKFQECSWSIPGSLLPVCCDIKQQLPVSSTHSPLPWQPACLRRHVVEPADFRLNTDETVKQNNPLLPPPSWSCLGQVVYQQEKKPMPEEREPFVPEGTVHPSVHHGDVKALN